MLSTDIIKDAEAFAGLKDEWNALLTRSSQNHLYLTHEFQYSWWENLSGGADLCVVAVRDGKELVALAPLMLSRGTLMRLPVNKIEFIGSGWGYGGFILTRMKRESVKAIFNALSRHGGWSLLYLSQMLGDPEIALSELPGLLPGGRFTASSSAVKIPYIPLDTTWDEYFSSRTTNYRRNARAKERKVAQLGKLRCERVKSVDGSGAGLEEVLGWLRDVADNSWKATAGTAISSNPEVFAFYTSLTKRLAESGFLDLYFIFIDDRPIAYTYGAIYDKVYYEIDIAFDESYSKASPGIAIRNLLLKELFTEDLRSFDFVANYDYKSEYTDSYHEYSTHIIYRLRPYPLMIKYLRNKVLPAIRRGGKQTGRKKYKTG